MEKIDFDAEFEELGFKRSYYGRGEWRLQLKKVGGTDIMNTLICHFLQNDNTLNWLTVELEQRIGKMKYFNKFTKYNWYVEDKEEMKKLITNFIKYGT